METANSQAKQSFLNQNNASRNLSTLDLHGLHVTEAIAQTDARIAECRKQGVDHLTIIVGRGSHSVDGVAKLRPAVMQMMGKYGVSVTPDKPNVGCIYVELDGKKEFRGVWDKCNIL